MNDAVVVGADSRIGHDLFHHLAEKYGVIGTSRRPVSRFHNFDLLYDKRELPPASITYFCAAINGFAGCARNPEFARTVNVTNVLASAERQVARGGRVVFLSSSAAENHCDKVYGQLKLETESGFHAFGDMAVCARFGPVAFPGRVVYPDGFYQPIEPHLLVRHLSSLITHWQPGIYRIFNTKTREAA